ncbi:MAG: NAD(P)-dependent oxidoreductase [Candidatus Methanomethylicia archaeon]
MIGIIGSSGFIGSKIKEIFSKENINNIGIYFNNHDGDISFEKFINSKYVENIDVLVICAGNSTHTQIKENFKNAVLKEVYYLYQLYENNFKGNLIFFSSAAVYDNYEGKVNEEKYIIPRNYYSYLKYLSENFVIMMAFNKKLKAIIFRPTHVFGLNNRRKRLFDNLLEGIKYKQTVTIHCDSDFYINPISVENVAKITLFFVKNNIFKNNYFFKNSYVEIFNLGSEENISFFQLLNYLKSKYNLEYKIEKKEELCQNYKFIVDSSKIYNFLKNMGFYLTSTWRSIDTFFYENLGL